MGILFCLTMRREDLRCSANMDLDSEIIKKKKSVFYLVSILYPVQLPSLLPSFPTTITDTPVPAVSLTSFNSSFPIPLAFLPIQLPPSLFSTSPKSGGDQRVTVAAALVEKFPAPPSVWAEGPKAGLGRPGFWGEIVEEVSEAAPYKKEKEQPPPAPPLCSLAR